MSDPVPSAPSEQTRAPIVAHAEAAAPPATDPIASATPTAGALVSAQQNTSARAAVPAANGHPASDLTPEPQGKPAQPLRSVSIDFTPDGASDVRLRLTQQAGDVHISLHSADPALAGHLSEGVHDLVGSLASAGYDAQAWTPDQGGQNQRPYEEQPKTRRNVAPGEPDFSEVFEQPDATQDTSR